MKQIEKRVNALLQANQKRAYANYPGVIIYDPETDPNGDKAYKEHCKKYPYCGGGSIVLLPEKDKLEEE